MIKRKFILLCLSFFTGFAIGVSIKNFYEVKTFKAYSWNSPPVIANCYGEDFSELQMVRAIHFWTIRGHQIAFYEHDPPESICTTNKTIHGFIILRKAKRFELSGSTLAVTKRATSGLTMKSAEIIYKPGSQNLSLINEHELGHALGYNHLNEEGHIMHPLFNKMGSKFWIE